MRTLLQLIGIFSTLGLAATSRDLSQRQDDSEWVKSRFELPKNTRIVNLSGFSSGLHVYPYMTDTDEDGWNRRPVLWYIYRDSGVDLKFDKKGQPLNPLPDKDVLYNLTCYHAVHKSAPNGAHFSQKLNLSAQTIIRPYGNDIWESLRGKANFYCPSGGCVHSDCQGQYIPNWTQELYDEQHGNTTTSRDPINQIAGTNSTSSSSAAATQSA